MAYAEILWCSLELSGPQTGLCKYMDEELWFKRTDLHSTDYELIRLPAPLLEVVKTDHINYCAVSGYPLKHGDAYRISKPQMMYRDPRVQVDVPLQVTEHRPMSNKITFVHSFADEDIVGELVTTISEQQFSNFHVERSFEYV